MQDGADQNIDDLLEGLEGTARTERAELVRWLLEQGITTEEIRTTNPPLLLATRHLIGDDGTYVSTREISETHGIDLGLLQRVQRAIGLVRVDDPDAVVHMRADGEAAAFAQRARNRQGVKGFGGTDRAHARPDDRAHVVHAAAPHDGNRGDQRRGAGRR